MSKVHKVVSGDTLGAIAIKYLGSFNKWHDIVLANPQLTGRKTAIDGSPLIFPDDILVIPVKEKYRQGLRRRLKLRTANRMSLSLSAERSLSALPAMN